LNRTSSFNATYTQGTGADISTSRLNVSTRAHSHSEDGWQADAIGIEVQFTPQSSASAPNWWIVGGGGREAYGLAPGGINSFTVVPVSSETVIGDTHLGIAYRVSDQAYASVGYVREKREFNLGREAWEEDEHYIGVGFQARW